MDNNITISTEKTSPPVVSRRSNQSPNRVSVCFSLLKVPLLTPVVRAWNMSDFWYAHRYLFDEGINQKVLKSQHFVHSTVIFLATFFCEVLVRRGRFRATLHFSIVRINKSLIWYDLTAGYWNTTATCAKNRKKIKLKHVFTGTGYTKPGTQQRPKITTLWTQPCQPGTTWRSNYRNLPVC